MKIKNEYTQLIGELLNKYNPTAKLIKEKIKISSISLKSIKNDPDNEGLTFDMLHKIIENLTDNEYTVIPCIVKKDDINTNMIEKFDKEYYEAVINTIKTKFIEKFTNRKNISKKNITITENNDVKQKILEFEDDEHNKGNITAEDIAKQLGTL